VLCENSAIFYVFAASEVGSRRIRPWNVTEHPTGEWTAQQFRTVTSDLGVPKDGCKY
jgi:hypothetical protein